MKTWRQRILVALAAAFLLTPALLLFPPVRERAGVAWFGSRLRSSDPMVRAGARRSLLALGRPAIDAVYPELVAGEVADERQIPDALVFVGKVKPGEPRAYDVETVIEGTPGPIQPVTGSPVCPTALLLLRRDCTRALVVAAKRPGAATPELRLEVPLDDATLEPRIMAAVRERLAR